MENPPSATIEKHASGDHRKWTLWHYVNERNKSLDACQHQVGSFDTLEGFWSAYYAVPPPCKIRMGDAYSLFKNGIRPTREDDTNKNGGRWELKQNKYFRSRDVDNVWLAVVKFIMGDDFASLEDICGAVVNIRARGHKICKHNSSSLLLRWTPQIWLTEFYLIVSIELQPFGHWILTKSEWWKLGERWGRVWTWIYRQTFRSISMSMQTKCPRIVPSATALNSFDKPVWSKADSVAVPILFFCYSADNDRN